MTPNRLRILTRCRVLLRLMLRQGQAATVATIGVVLSLLAYGLALRFDDARVGDALLFRAEWRAKDIEAKVNLAAAPVMAAAAFVTAQNRLFPSEFQPFMRELGRGGSGLRRVNWLPWLRHEEREGFEHLAREGWESSYRISDRSPEGALVAAMTRPFYAPILLGQAVEDAAPPPFGLDLLQHALHGPMLRRAADTAQPLANVIVPPASSAGEQPSRHLVIPVFDGAKPRDTVELRRGALRGFIFGDYRIATLLQFSIRETPAIDETIRFFVGPADRSQPERLVAVYDPGRRGFVPPAAILDFVPPTGTRLELGFSDFGQHWRLEFNFPKAVTASFRSAAPVVLLLSCLLLTLMVSGYVLRQQNLRRHVEAMVVARTQDLSQANVALAQQAEERGRAEMMLRSQAENLSAALAVMPVAILYLDPRHRILFWSAAAERIFGYSADEVLRKRYALAPDADRQATEAALACVAAGEVVSNHPVHVQHRDGRVLDADFSGAGLFDAGMLRGIVGVLEDTTQRKATEAQLLHAQKMDALGQLTGGLAHDFNNLLLVIMGNLQLLQDRRAGDELVQEFSSQAYEAATRGAELVRSLLAFARRQPLQPRSMNINAVVSTMTKMLSRVLGEQVEISLQLCSDPWPVMIDPVQLEAALANLATNARDAMPRGGRLTIATANQHLDEGYVSLHPDVTMGDYTMLQVSDTGEGIPPETMARIFEPFFSTKEPGRGSGLGLSMVFGFMKQSGGHINVYSEVGVGTTFRLYLPRHHGAVTADVTVAAASPVGGGETILVVEDDPALRRLAVLQISNLGYRVLEAENATAALALLETGTPVNLLFSDVVMAGKMDGLDLARLVPQRWPKVKIILTSGFPDANIPHHPDDPCAPRLLSKPYRREDMARLLREMLDCNPMDFWI